MEAIGQRRCAELVLGPTSAWSTEGEGVRLAAVVGVLLSVALPSFASADPLPPDLAVTPFTGTASDDNLAFVQQHVIYWVRRWGQPCDDPKQVEARLGLDGLRGLSAAQGPYAAALNGTFDVGPGSYIVVLVVKGLKDGAEWATIAVSAPTLVELLDKLSDAAHEIAETVARRTGRPVVHYVPPTRPYSTIAFAAGGALLATGAVFFILSGVEDGKLSNPSTSLPDAVSARNAAKTYAIVGYSLTAAAAAGLVVGLFLFKPGATPPAPGVSVSVDPVHGMVLVSGPLP
jgi:hypothetical protein